MIVYKGHGDLHMTLEEMQSNLKLKQSIHKFIKRCRTFYNKHYFKKWWTNGSKMEWEDCGNFYYEEVYKSILWKVEGPDFEILREDGCQTYFIHIKTLLGVWLFKEFYEITIR